MPYWKNWPASKTPKFQSLDLRTESGQKPALSPEMDGALRGELLMLNFGESPSVAAESRLSRILEDNVPEKYYLSARACQGILNRASRRGKALPEILHTALLDMIEWWKERESAVPTVATNASYQDTTGPLMANSHPGSYCGQDAYTDMFVICKEKFAPDVAHTLRAKANCSFREDAETFVSEKILRWIVRRLTPTECERLQGFPDGWTDIGEWADSNGRRRKEADSPRYKALGNSIALPQWWWITCKMAAYLPEHATLGSLFDGIGGFPLVWEERHGKGTAVWASEIEEFPIAVTQTHFPEE